MRQLSWRSLEKVKILAKTDVLWSRPESTQSTPAKPDMRDIYIEGPVHLQIQVDGKWRLDKQTECGPDGSLKDGFKDDALLKTAPMGALIAKIGGSTAEKPTEGGATVFAVGSFCIVRVAAETRGTLYFAMNDVTTEFADHSGELTAEILIAR
jgi:hypothetical protein